MSCPIDSLKILVIDQAEDMPTEKMRISAQPDHGLVKFG
jgi:hypothetical protein